MRQTIRTLKRIEEEAIELGRSIRKEGQIYRLELEERICLGLHGDEAVKHYNEWMQRYGMDYLMVKDLL